jgi:hypothetical protein
MNLTTTTTLALLALAAGAAWYLGGREGTGVLAGFLAGASVAGLSLALQRHIARERPRVVIHALFAGFLLKAFVMLGATLIVAFVPPISRACDPVMFLIAFAGAALLILLPATLDTLRIVAPRRAEPGAVSSRGTEESRLRPEESRAL